MCVVHSTVDVTLIDLSTVVGLATRQLLPTKNLLGFADSMQL